MNNKTIWLDHQHAYIFDFNSNKIFEKRFVKKSDDKMKHIDPQNKFKHAKEHQKLFYQMLTLELGKPDQLLILGPGIAKEEFKHYYELHNNGALGNIIISSQPMKSHPRKSEILKISRNTFEKQLKFETPNYATENMSI